MSGCLEDDAYEVPEGETVEAGDADFFSIEDVVETGGEKGSVSAEAGDGDVTETGGQHVAPEKEGCGVATPVLEAEKDIASPENTESEKNESSSVKLENSAEKEEDDLLPPNSKVRLEGYAFRTDDNGICHMYYDKDERNWFLLPNHHYVSNSYEYRTGSYGEILSGEGKLRLSDGERRALNVSLDTLAEGDQRSHVIGDRFQASNRADNIVAMLSQVNQGGFKSLETQLAKAVGEGREVFLRVQLEYDDPETRRPSSLVCRYSIDGVEHEAVFSNKK